LDLSSPQGGKSKIIARCLGQERTTDRGTTVRLGLIGLGRIGAFHAETLARLDRVHELVLTDAQPTVSAAAAARLGASVGITVVPTAAEVLACGVDGVVIASATASHLELLEAALRARVPAFCEKPVAADPAAAARLVPLAQYAGVPVQVGFPRRFDPAFRRAKNDLDAGVLGRLTTVRSTTLDPAPPPAAYLATSGGIFRDCSIHDLDTVRWVTGATSSRYTPSAAMAARRSFATWEMSTPRRFCSPSTTERSASSPTRATTAGATTSVSSCTGRSTPSQPVSTSRSRSGPPTRP
jgi:predicted dehydrogenase